MFHAFLFLAIAGVCVAGALNFLLQRHPVNSALSLIVVMGSLALLFLMLGAEFVAAVQVIVYAGAVMVLFVLSLDLVLGLGTRFAAAGLLLMTCVIELTVPDGWPIHFTWAAMALGIAAWGPGLISIDGLLGDRANRS